MKTSFELESILYGILNVRTIKNAISGGIYLGDTRPEDSGDEDITINTITVSSDVCPQTATSNVNIHVPDVDANLGGKVQKVANRIRLKALTNLVFTELRNADLTGIKIVPMLMSTMAETSINQHYINIRIDWNIQID